MKQSELIQLINTPQNAVISDVDKLDILTKEFPFFQSAHVLLTIASKKHNSGLYQQTLRNTAISIPNRSRLHYLLNLNDTTAPQIEPVVELKKEVEIKQPVEPVSEIDHLKKVELQVEKVLTEEELTEQVEKEVEKQLVSALIEKQILSIPEKEKENKKEKMSSGTFTDWLKSMKEGVTESELPEKEQAIEVKITEPIKVPLDKKLEQKLIIDKIIEANPSNIRLKGDQKFFAADNKAKESLFENEDLVTETLAKIYALQGNIPKAIRAYEILSLKFPQKSVYFASLIENLKKK